MGSTIQILKPLDIHILAKKESAIEKQLKEEEKILESIAEKKALMGVAELARGIQYEDPIKTRYSNRATFFFFSLA